LACGTPALTLNKQGPKETISNGTTGWLANDEVEFLRLAAQVWKESYSRTFRRNCRQRTLEFDVNNIAKEWTALLNDIHD